MYAFYFSGTSAFVSLIALGWAVAAYNNALRQAYRDNYRVYWPGLTLQTLWHIFMVASRVAAIVAFASVFKSWIFLVLGEQPHSTYHMQLTVLSTSGKTSDICMKTTVLQNFF